MYGEIIINGEGEKSKSVLIKNTKTYIGRDRSCEIRLDHPDVALRHCLILISDNGFPATVHNLCEYKPALLNGDLIFPSECQLKDGDIITIGSKKLEWSYNKRCLPSSSNSDAKVGCGVKRTRSSEPIHKQRLVAIVSPHRNDERDLPPKKRRKTMFPNMTSSSSTSLSSNATAPTSSSSSSTSGAHNHVTHFTNNNHHLAEMSYSSALDISRRDTSSRFNDSSVRNTPLNRPYNCGTNSQHGTSRIPLRLGHNRARLNSSNTARPPRVGVSSTSRTTRPVQNQLVASTSRLVPLQRVSTDINTSANTSVSSRTKFYKIRTPHKISIINDIAISVQPINLQTLKRANRIPIIYVNEARFDSSSSSGSTSDTRSIQPSTSNESSLSRRTSRTSNVKNVKSIRSVAETRTQPNVGSTSSKKKSNTSIRSGTRKYYIMGSLGSKLFKNTKEKLNLSLPNARKTPGSEKGIGRKSEPRGKSEPRPSLSASNDARNIQPSTSNQSSELGKTPSPNVQKGKSRRSVSETAGNKSSQSKSSLSSLNESSNKMKKISAGDRKTTVHLKKDERASKETPNARKTEAKSSVGNSNIQPDISPSTSLLSENRLNQSSTSIESLEPRKTPSHNLSYRRRSKTETTTNNNTSERNTSSLPNNESDESEEVRTDLLKLPHYYLKRGQELKAFGQLNSDSQEDNSEASTSRKTTCIVGGKSSAELSTEVEANVEASSPNNTNERNRIPSDAKKLLNSNTRRKSVISSNVQLDSNNSWIDEDELVMNNTLETTNKSSNRSTSFRNTSPETYHTPQNDIRRKKQSLTGKSTKNVRKLSSVVKKPALRLKSSEKLSIPEIRIDDSSSQSSYITIKSTDSSLLSAGKTANTSNSIIPETPRNNNESAKNTRSSSKKGPITPPNDGKFKILMRSTRKESFRRKIFTRSLAENSNILQDVTLSPVERNSVRFDAVTTLNAESNTIPSTPPNQSSPKTVMRSSRKESIKKFPLEKSMNPNDTPVKSPDTSELKLSSRYSAQSFNDVKNGSSNAESNTIPSTPPNQCSPKTVMRSSKKESMKKFPLEKSKNLNDTPLKSSDASKLKLSSRYSAQFFKDLKNRSSNVESNTILSTPPNQSSPKIVMRSSKKESMKKFPLEKSKNLNDTPVKSPDTSKLKLSSRYSSQFFKDLKEGSSEYENLLESPITSCKLPVFSFGSSPVTGSSAVTQPSLLENQPGTSSAAKIEELASCSRITNNLFETLEKPLIRRTYPGKRCLSKSYEIPKTSQNNNKRFFKTFNEKLDSKYINEQLNQANTEEKQSLNLDVENLSSHPNNKSDSLNLRSSLKVKNSRKSTFKTPRLSKNLRSGKEEIITSTPTTAAGPTPVRIVWDRLVEFDSNTPSDVAHSSHSEDVEISLQSKKNVSSQSVNNLMKEEITPRRSPRSTVKNSVVTETSLPRRTPEQLEKSSKILNNETPKTSRSRFSNPCKKIIKSSSESNLSSRVKTASKVLSRSVVELSKNKKESPIKFTRNTTISRISGKDTPKVKKAEEKKIMSPNSKGRKSVVLSAKSKINKTPVAAKAKSASVKKIRSMNQSIKRSPTSSRKLLKANRHRNCLTAVKPVSKPKVTRTRTLSHPAISTKATTPCKKRIKTSPNKSVQAKRTSSPKAKIIKEKLHSSMSKFETAKKKSTVKTEGRNSLPAKLNERKTPTIVVKKTAKSPRVSSKITTPNQRLKISKSCSSAKKLTPKNTSVKLSTKGRQLNKASLKSTPSLTPKRATPIARKAFTERKPQKLSSTILKRKLDALCLEKSRAAAKKLKSEPAKSLDKKKVAALLICHKKRQEKNIVESSAMPSTSFEKSPKAVKSPTPKIKKLCFAGIDDITNPSKTTIINRKKTPAKIRTSSKLEDNKPATVENSLPEIDLKQEETFQEDDIFSALYLSRKTSTPAQEEKPLRRLRSTVNKMKMSNSFDSSTINTSNKKHVLFATPVADYPGVKQSAEVGECSTSTTPNVPSYLEKNNDLSLTEDESSNGKESLNVKNTSKDFYCNVSGVKNILHLSHQADYTNVSGVKKVLSNVSPQPDYTNVSCLKRNIELSPKADYTDVAGIKSLFELKPMADYSNVTCMKRVFTTSPVANYTDVTGVKQIFTVPPTADYVNNRGLKELRPASDYLNLSGVQELFKEQPKTTANPVKKVRKKKTVSEAEEETKAPPARQLRCRSVKTVATSKDQLKTEKETMLPKEQESKVVFTSNEAGPSTSNACRTLRRGRSANQVKTEEVINTPSTSAVGTKVKKEMPDISPQAPQTNIAAENTSEKKPIRKRTANTRTKSATSAYSSEQTPKAGKEKPDISPQAPQTNSAAENTSKKKPNTKKTANKRTKTASSAYSSEQTVEKAKEKPNRKKLKVNKDESDEAVRRSTRKAMSASTSEQTSKADQVFEKSSRKRAKTAQNESQSEPDQSSEFDKPSRKNTRSQSAKKSNKLAVEKQQELDEATTSTRRTTRSKVAAAKAEAKQTKRSSTKKSPFKLVSSLKGSRTATKVKKTVHFDRSYSRRSSGKCSRRN